MPDQVNDVVLKLVLVLALLGLAGPAHAVDGVIEINQARAEAGGITADDTAGFPVTISEPGSYRLTSNLTLPSANASGIFITVSHVTVDLNGFAIEGPVTCEASGETTTCEGASNFDGIGASSFFNDVSVVNVTILNGTVRGTGRVGVNLNSRHSRVERVHAVQNGSTGIRAALGSTLTENRSVLNGGDGIGYSDGCLVGQNVSSQNGRHGINGTGEGSSSAVGSTVIGNVSSFNNGNGIQSDDACLLKANTVVDNDGRGLDISDRLGGRTGYGSNVISNNGDGTVSGGVDLGSNLCDGSTTCP